ncbi:Gfo/Idh/MocA family protein [Alteribacter keqinensis]|uniref:Gfo/Idh/MocA family oxidoreductase n=1 Tax=Alteribacter keqinensis TaxID=2483800 RepID=A0A3M7TPW0_9BACI|nr:Gfo/Idh/MocA family oxidoreductase [Alteribacter keqinensis]RNA67674.1 gfo/Idh/MocA family oxidoreductase [Alteribacter keqinensis]
MVKIVLVGTGTMGGVHAGAYSKMDDVTIAGIVDKDEKALDAMVRAYNSKGFTSVEELIESGLEFDLIDICLPTPLHSRVAKLAADAGKSIICEKPLARTVEEARELVDYCEEKDVKLFVGHVVRFFHEYSYVKKRVEEGAVGKPCIARTFRGGAFPQGRENWYADPENSGGLVLDMIIHDFDFLRWCFGEVERVTARGLLEYVEKGLDYALATIVFKNGVMAHVEGSWAHEGFSTALEIAGEDGVLELPNSRNASVELEQRKVSLSEGGVMVPKSPVVDDPYYLELKHFIECWKTGEIPLVTADDACEALKIAHAVLESIKTKEPVTLS